MSGVGDAAVVLRGVTERLTKHYVYADLPHAGLGNMLLVWARARVFATLNELPLLVGRWSRPTIGPYLRFERTKRRYGGAFRVEREAGALESLYALGAGHRIHEPPCRKVSLGRRARPTTFVFHEIPHWSDYFGSIKDHRDLVRDALHAMLADETRASLARLRAPTIGVHVRMGDYRTLAPGTDFARVGTTRTPLSYFVEVIERLRSLSGAELPVTIFSDGHDHELRELTRLTAVARAPRAPDIVEMLSLAQSRIIVCSAGSTFGYWSAFLAEAPVLLHPDHIHNSIRDSAANARYYEGALTTIPSGLLLQNLRAIRDI